MATTAAAAANSNSVKTEGGTDPNNTDTDADTSKNTNTASVVTQSFPPSHILQDGRFIHLPPPNEHERSKFFERSIAKYGLLEADMTTTQTKQKEEEDEAASEKETAPKVHPLAIASARLQAAGVAELNRAINLSTLVNTGEYFGLTNIVDPSLELGAAKEGGGSAGTGTATPSAAAAAAAAGSANVTAATAAAAAAAAEAPTPDAAAAAAAAAASSSTTTTPAAATSAPAPASHPNAALNEKEMQEEQRVKSAYVLKRKRAVFDKASKVLQRHQTRLDAALHAQAVPDQRLRQLRPQWRLVAPEHGSRARPHAVRPTEVVAVDVDVYDPTGGNNSNSSLVGRLASRVPRFATIELTEQYQPSMQEELTSQKKTKQEQGNNQKKEEQAENDDKEDKAIKKEDAMEVDDDEEASQESHKKVKMEEQHEEESATQKEPATAAIQDDKDDKGDNQKTASHYTRAEPFAIADPTLGKTLTDFDPNKVSFLTLQFDIEKPSTGFCMSSCLEPMATTTVEKAKEQEKTKPKPKQEEGSQMETNTKGEEEESTKPGDDDAPSTTYPNDEQVLVSLQHSLFCAKLFESIRKELMGDDTQEDGAGGGGSQQQQQKHTQQELQRQQPVVWLSSEAEENFLPPPSLMVRPTTNSSGAELCVIHCHASEVKVQLDNEYTLRAKLVEADEQTKTPMPDANTTTANEVGSGSQTPQQLHLLCRSLLLHAQEVYHKHSLHESRVAAEKQRLEEEKKQEAQKPRGLDRIQKKELKTLPKILQSCVGLGTKMLFEHRIRKSLVRVRKWLKTKHPNIQDTLKTEWLSLSLFDLHSHFSLSFGTMLTIDVTIVRDEMTITSYGSAGGRREGSSGEYRKVKFHSDAEFEIFLKIELRRLLRNQQREVLPVAPTQ